MRPPIATLLVLCLLGGSLNWALGASNPAIEAGHSVVRTTAQHALPGDQTLQLDITMPAASGAQKQSAPAIVLLQGGAVPRDEYRWLADALAAAGYVVVMPEHPGNFAIRGLGNAAYARDFLVTAPAGSALTRSVDPARIAVIGHSLGGVVAAKAARTGGFAALVLLASYPEQGDREALSALKLPSLSIAGELDCVTSLAEVRDGAAFLPAPVSVVVLAGVTHYQFTDHDDKDRKPGCEPGVSLATAHASIAAAVKDFLGPALVGTASR